MIALALSLVLSLAAGAPSQEAPLELVRSIPMPDVSGRIDHLALDRGNHRLFVAALGNDSVEVVDLAKGERVASKRDLPEPQGIAFVPSSKRVLVACGGDGSVRALDAATLEELARVDVGEDADNLRLDLDAGRAWVAYGGGGLAAIELAQMEVRERVALGGHPESFQLESDGRIFANVPALASIVVVGEERDAVRATWSLDGAAANFPMALDAKRSRLYVACRRPAKLLVIDARTGAVAASVECVSDADDVFVDAANARLYVAGGGGSLDCFALSDEAPPKRVQQLATASGARTALFVPEDERLYVAAPARGGEEARILELRVRPAGG